ncbi:MAG TPA: sodium:calcium antiporter, partial [Candidatus Nealsonbacteria bacterium]|nr:sodium:calcium antiporter [Candidatus Nealsonbacteria bacterium]
AGTFIIDSLMRIAKFLRWKEFVVAFFVIAIASSIPNFFVGISSALHGIPQLSFGDVVGGNIVDLTVAVALVVLITKGLPTTSNLIQVSSLFTILIAILPVVLILDGTLGRVDGILLIGFFFFYVFWLFSKKERFIKVYDGQKLPIVKELKTFFKDIGRVAIGIILLLLGAEGIVRSASFFAISFNLSLPIIGVLIVGTGNALPEIYFAIASARKGRTRMILGDLMGSVIIAATLVLGTVALIHPIEISDFSPFAIARLFLIISAIFFFFFIRTGRKITRKEALFLLLIYLIFLVSEIFFT